MSMPSLMAWDSMTCWRAPHVLRLRLWFDVLGMLILPLTLRFTPIRFNLASALGEARPASLSVTNCWGGPKIETLAVWKLVSNWSSVLLGGSTATCHLVARQKKKYNILPVKQQISFYYFVNIHCQRCGGLSVFGSGRPFSTLTACWNDVRDIAYHFLRNTCIS